MNYQWYPGHMTKAIRSMQEDIKLIDLVIEIVDARIPVSSRNPDIDKLAQGKGRLILLNKSDLADNKANKEWLGYYKSQNIQALLIDSSSDSPFSSELEEGLQIDELVTLTTSSSDSDTLSKQFFL